MNRLIKFRGKRKRDGQWLYGFYLVNRGLHYIVEDGIQSPFATPEDFEIDPDTLGQFTGALDCQGNEIYEEDVIHSCKFGTAVSHVVHYCQNESAFKVYGEWGHAVSDNPLIQDWVFKYGKEVIGNIHDNPKLNKKGMPATSLE